MTLSFVGIQIAPKAEKKFCIYLFARTLIYMTPFINIDMIWAKGSYLTELDHND